MLTKRRKQVLEALVNEYISYATPVGSRTICERYEIGVSSATVRNELANLEETGYVVSPHTSAGRIPTDTGYRSFVDGLLSRDDIVFDENTSKDFVWPVEEINDLVKESCNALARHTNCLAVLLAPSFERILLKRISLVSLAPRRGLIIVVTQDGQVLDTHTEFRGDVSAADLQRLEALLNSLIVGETFEDLRISVLPQEIAAQCDGTLEDILLEIIKLIEESDQDRIHHWGMSALLSQPEFKNAHHVLPIASLLEDNWALLSLFSNMLDSQRPVVRIGHENDSEAFEEISFVAQGYTVKDAKGLVAVIGPTRMDYARAISAVSAVSHTFEEAY